MQQNQSCSCPYTNSLQPPMRLLNQEGGSDFLVFDNRGKERGDPGCRGKKGRTKEQEKQVKGRVGMDPHSLMRIHTQATLIPPAMQSQHAHHCILKGLVQHPGGRESRSFYHILLQMRKYSSPCPLPVHVPGCIFVRLSSTEVEH